MIPGISGLGDGQPILGVQGPDPPVRWNKRLVDDRTEGFGARWTSRGCYDPPCPVWLYVNDGTVTAIAEHFLTG